MTHRVDVVSRTGRVYVAVAALAAVRAAIRVRAAARVVCLLAPRLRSERVGLSGTKSQVLSVNAVLGVRLSD